MSDLRSAEFERVLAAWIAETAAPREVDYLPDVFAATAETRQRPTWRSPGRRLAGEFVDRARAVARPAWAVLALILLLALIAGTIAVGSLPRLPAPFGLAANGLIALDSGDRIVLMRADGSDRRIIPAATGEVDTNPWWSPDGTRLAFWRAQPDGRWAIVVADPKGAVRAVVPTRAPVPRRFENTSGTTEGLWASHAHGAPSRLAWSPDSGRIAFSLPVRGMPRVWLVRADGTGLAQVGDPDLRASDPVWSPDGTRIAFHGGSSFRGEAGVYVMQADGTGARKVSHVEANESWGATWQPGGELIAFMAAPVERSNVYVVRSDGSGETDVSSATDVVAGDTVNDGWAAWSPDGSKIAFRRAPDLSLPVGQIIVSGADGSNALALPPVVGSDRVEWSPDGTFIAAFRYDPDAATYDAFVRIDVSGRSPPLTVPVLNAGGAGWQRLAP